MHFLQNDPGIQQNDFTCYIGIAFLCYIKISTDEDNNPNNKLMTNPSIAHTASVMFSQFLSFLLSTGGGGSRQMQYLANVPGIEHILAIKVLMPVCGVGGGGV